MLVRAFVLVFGDFGCFPYTMSVMQRWILYSGKACRIFCLPRSVTLCALTGLTTARGVKLSPLGFCAPKGQTRFQPWGESLIFMREGRLD